MTFQIDDDIACFTCDTCPEHIECHGCGRDFTAAKIFAQRAGWKTYKGPDDQWANACPVCVEIWAKRAKGKTPMTTPRTYGDFCREPTEALKLTPSETYDRPGPDFNASSEAIRASPVRFPDPPATPVP